MRIYTLKPEDVQWFIRIIVLIMSMTLVTACGGGGPNSGESERLVINESDEAGSSLFTQKPPDPLVPTAAAGLFASAATYNLADVRGLASADLNKDGRPEIIATQFKKINQSGGTLNFFSWGSIDEMVLYKALDAPGNPERVAVADLDNDGNADLIVSYGTSQVRYERGAGDGGVVNFGSAGSCLLSTICGVPTFSGRILSAVYPLSLVVTPRDDRGVVFIANVDTNTEGQVKILGFDGSGNVVANQGMGAKLINPVGLAAADFNNDGELDFVTSQKGANLLTICYGPNHVNCTNFPTGAAPAEITAYDFNKDGRMDLAVTHSGTNYLSVFLGRDCCEFDRTDINIDGITGAIIAADFNNDGVGDLVAGDISNNRLIILLGAGDGVNYEITSISLNAPPVALITVDLNSDGVKDLVVSTRDNINVYKNK